MVRTYVPICMTGKEIDSLDIFSGRFQSDTLVVGVQEALRGHFKLRS